jgi:acetylornithine deacetylase
MSTANNSEQLFDDSVKILTDLIGFKTISGEDNSSLIDYCDDILKKLGATSFRTYDDEKKRVNLFATLKAKSSQTKKPIILSGPHGCGSCFKRMELRSFHRRLLKETSYMVEDLVT